MGNEEYDNDVEYSQSGEYQESDSRWEGPEPPEFDDNNTCLKVIGAFMLTMSMWHGACFFAGFGSRYFFSGSLCYDIKTDQLKYAPASVSGCLIAAEYVSLNRK